MKAVLLLFLSCVLAGAASHCVLPASTGSADGSDWSNAYGGLPSSLTRGDTYYIGSGTYSSYTFDDAESGTSVISILKATASEHGATNGWQTAYGVTNALMYVPDITRSYYTFDGMTGSGRANYGFQWNGQTRIGEEGREGLTGHLVFKRINIHYYPTSDGYAQMGDDSDIVGWTTFAQLFQITHGGTNFLFQSNWMHRVFGCPFQTRSVDSLTIDRCLIELNKGTAANHSAGIADDNSDNVIISNNEWLDIENTAFIDLVASVIGTAYNWSIYNNVFWHSGTFGAGDGAMIVANNDVNNHSTPNGWKIFNNTFANLNAICSLSFPSATTTNVIIYNNYFWQNRSNNLYEKYIYFASGNELIFDYNWYSAAAAPGFHTPGAHEPATVAGPNCPLWPIPSSFPFVDWTTGDFRLVAVTDNGTNTTSLLAATAYDKNGFARTNGAWDRGAYAFGSIGPATDTPGIILNVTGTANVNRVNYVPAQ